MAYGPLQPPKIWGQGPTPHIKAKLQVFVPDEELLDGTYADNIGTPNENPVYGDDVGYIDAFIDRDKTLFGFLTRDITNDPPPPASSSIIWTLAQLFPVWGFRGAPGGDKGPQGEVGPAGPQGAIGRRGPKGVKGGTGPEGDSGWVNEMFTTPGQPTWTAPGTPGTGTFTLRYIMQNPGAGNGFDASASSVIGTAIGGQVTVDYGSTVTLNIPVGWSGGANGPALTGKSVYRTWFDYVEGGVTKTVYPTYNNASGVGSTLMQGGNDHRGAVYVSNALQLTNPNTYASQTHIVLGGSPGCNGYLSGVGGGGSYGGIFNDVVVLANQPGEPTGCGSSCGFRLHSMSGGTYTPVSPFTGGGAYIWLLHQEIS